MLFPWQHVLTKFNIFFIIIFLTVVVKPHKNKSERESDVFSLLVQMGTGPNWKVIWLKKWTTIVQFLPTHINLGVLIHNNTVQSSMWYNSNICTAMSATRNVHTCIQSIICSINVTLLCYCMCTNSMCTHSARSKSFKTSII